MYGYIYRTINTKNGKKYVGQHKAEKFDENYKGSGKILKQAFKKYGFNNFKVELLQECETADDLDKAEEFWIAKYNAAKSEEYYNILKGGNKNSYIVTQETKDKISKATKGFVYVKKGKTTRRISKEEIDSYLQQGWQRGFYKRTSERRAISERVKKAFENPEVRYKCGTGTRGKVWIYKENERKIINPSELDSYLQQGWRRGVLLSEECKKKLEEAHKGKSMKEESKQKMIDGLHEYWNEDRRVQRKLKMSKLAKETDFKEKISKSTKEALSRKDIKQKMKEKAAKRWSNIEERKIQSERVKQTRWYTNGITPKKINLKDVDKYLNLGYKPGRQLWLS